MDKQKVKQILVEMVALTNEERAFLVRKLMKHVQKDAHDLQLSLRRLELRDEWADAKIKELTLLIPCKVLTDDEKNNIEKFKAIAMRTIDNCEIQRKAIKAALSEDDN